MYTIIFNAFIMMQLFNMINARKLGERQFNIFSGLFNNGLFIVVYVLMKSPLLNRPEKMLNNGLFIVVYVLMWLVQIASTMYGGRPLRTVPLTLEQNLICAGIGAFSLVWAVFVKMIPGSWFDWVHMSENEMDDKEEEQSMQAKVRKSFR